MAFLCLLTLDLHFPDNASLKGKRKEVQSLKAQLHRRFGAAVAETGHHDLWQRATLSVALVGGEQRRLSDSADAVQRFTESRFGDLVRWERQIVSTDDLRGD
jgi:uncharacterized protein YlxP (DUF503 family)